jgi:hypothetical protein
VIVLLLIILGVGIANLALLGAYLAHELGWFPHGKPRGVTIRTVDRFERPAAIEDRRSPRRPHSIERPHPSADILRRFGHAEVYGAADVADELANAITYCQNHPDDWSRRDDLLGLVNIVGADSKRSEHADQLIERAVAVLAATGETLRERVQP